MTSCQATLSVLQNVVLDNDRITVCSNLGLGLTSQVQASECVCDLGYGYDAGSAACQPCSIQEYKNTIGSETCQVCASNMLTLPGSVNVEFCLCSPGFTYDGVDSCTACQINTYKAHYGNDNCLVCFDNSVSEAESISQNNCVCKPGYSVDASAADINLKCQPCDTQSYKSESGMQACTQCPSNSETQTGGSIDASSCLCSIGYTHDGSNCVPCNKGEFKDAIGNQICDTCNALETTDATGSVSNAACICDQGAFLSEGNCIACAAGSYKDVTGSQPCTPCSATSYAASGASSCINCPANSHSNYAGFTKTGTIDDCICDAGYERSGDACIPCGLGYFKELHGNAEMCDACHAGQYQDATAQTYCENCVVNSISGQASTHVDQCLCLAGFTLSGEVCEQCADGFIKTNNGNEACIACARGKYSTSTTFCQDCVLNSYTAASGSYEDSQCECVATFQKATTAEGFICEACEAGFYCPGANAKLQCIAHSSSPPSSDETSDCKCIDGYYRTDLNACAECPVEHFCVDEAMHHCFQNSNSDTGQSQETQCTCNAGYERTNAA